MPSGDNDDDECEPDHDDDHESSIFLLKDTVFQYKSPNSSLCTLVNFLVQLNICTFLPRTALRMSTLAPNCRKMLHPRIPGTHAPRHPYSDDNEDHNSATDVQNTHGRPPLTMPTILPLRCLATTLPKVRKPYPSATVRPPEVISLFPQSFISMMGSGAM